MTQMLMGELAAPTWSVRTAPTAVVACVAGEQHSLGSRTVADCLGMAGWRALWLGPSTPGAELLRLEVKQLAALLALSCTHAPCLHEVAALIASLRALPECSQVRVLVGGHAFQACDKLWLDVDADAYAPDAGAATRVATTLMVGRD